jgi:hypothetical protein
VPLASTLDDLERVEAVGRTTGDIEYAGYAAHAYVHNAFYASRELVPLLEKARAATAFIRRHEQMNALHVHVPFERALVCFTGGAPDRASLTGGGFEEEAALAEAKAAGSRSAQLIVRLLMGMVRLHFGSIEAASACFEEARPFLDGVVSTWHVPMFHQLAALAIHALPPQARGPLVARAESDLAALRALSVHGPANFAHRVALLEAASARAERRLAEARVSVASAIEGARAGGWLHDLGLAHELGARIAEEGGDRGAHAEHAKRARDAYARWGATAKLR